MLALTGDYFEPYATTGIEEVVTGEDEVAILQVTNPFSQVLRSTILVNGREVSQKVYSLADDSDPHIHQLLLSDETVTGVRVA